MHKGQSGQVLVYLATATLAIVALYFGKPVLMPIALATLLAFLLSPLVNALSRAGLRQSIAVVLVVVFMFSLLGAMIWGFGRQMTSLVYQLPDYRENIREKIADLRSAGSGSTLERVRQAWREIKGDLKRPVPAATNAPPKLTVQITNATPAEVEPVPVVVRGQSTGTVAYIPTALGPFVEVLAMAGLVVVLVIFMLLRKRELRNRFIVLCGYSRMPTATRALDEAAERISRYLVMQTIINGSYGLAVGTALYFLGLPYALMWGFLAALLRFIPYVGPWLGALMPILLSLAVFPGWLHPFLVLGLILIFELISNMFMEPLLYGQTVGVSEVALITAVAFWTWIWGPIGLALATPLTVCFVVLGKYVPGLSFLPLLMGDEPVMKTPQLLYQRLLAMDDTEVHEIVTDYRRKHELIGLYDDLLLPALESARRDFLSKALAPDHLDYIVATTGQLISKTAAEARGSTVLEASDDAHEVLGIPVEDTIDELAMSMLANVLPPSIVLKSVSANALSGEVLDQVHERGVSVVCIGAISPGGANESRYLAKRLNGSFPELAIILARWGLRNERKHRELSELPGLKAVPSTIAEARNYIVELVRIADGGAPVADHADAPARPRAAAGEPGHPAEIHSN
jgi:predicted PurR-regulated permease PerM